MTSPRLVAFALPLALLLGSCDRGPTAPAAAHGLELSVHVGLPNSGNFPTFATTVMNTSAQQITLVFSGCGLFPYIDDVRGNNVYPGSGAGNCGGAISEVTLNPERVISGSVELHTGPTRSLVGSMLTLPPGRYVAYAEMEGFIGELGGQRVKLRARNVWFTLP